MAVKRDVREFHEYVSLVEYLSLFYYIKNIFPGVLPFLQTKMVEILMFDFFHFAWRASIL